MFRKLKKLLLLLMIAEDFLQVEFLVPILFFQAEDGIRDFHVTGVRRVLFRSPLGREIQAALDMALEQKTEIAMEKAL